MSGPLSLEGSLRTCKVRSGMAPQFLSDRIIGGPEQRVCPMPRPFDAYGRESNFMTLQNKSAGCNDPLEIVSKEIDVVRPQYYQFINLNPNGLFGDFDNVQRKETMYKNSALQGLSETTGQFGQQMSSAISPGGKCHASTIGMISNNIAQQQRFDAQKQIFQGSKGYRTLSGY